MGLESATFIADLIGTNPIATDKKNQGDDHLRLLKNTLQTTFPAANRAFRLPTVSSQSGAYSVLVTDDQQTILVNTASGDVAMFLPTPTFAGWQISFLKSTSDGNSILVLPPTGNINGQFPRMRIGVPFTEYTFVWSGAAFYRKRAAGEALVGAIEWLPMSAAVGYAIANGTALVRVDYPELFACYGTTYGAPSGATFSLPDLRDRFPVGAGLSYAHGSTGGESTHQLTVAELASHPHSGTADSNGVDHTHPETLPPSTSLQGSGLISPNNGWNGAPSNSGTTGGASAYLHGHNLSINAAGGNVPHENRPPYFGLYPMIRLC